MKQKKWITTAVVALVAICLGITVAAYDSSEDPIISLSYLTDIFRSQILAEVDKKVETAVNEKVAALPLTPAESGDQPETPGNVSSGYTVIEMTTGDILYAGDACDIMLRAGEAVCIAPDPKQGIADYTDATEILNGQSLTKNHMCLIPRGDGRGVLAASQSVYIMVRGTYSIVKH